MIEKVWNVSFNIFTFYLKINLSPINKQMNEQKVKSWYSLKTELEMNGMLSDVNFDPTNKSSAGYQSVIVVLSILTIIIIIRRQL